MDQKYADDLSPEEKAWLSDFNEEYYGANLDYENLENNRFHKTEEEKKACTDRVNARNRCMYSIARATKHLAYLDESPNITLDNDSVNVRITTPEALITDSSDPNIEDALIDYIDSKDEES